MLLQRLLQPRRRQADLRSIFGNAEERAQLAQLDVQIPRPRLDRPPFPQVVRENKRLESLSVKPAGRPRDQRSEAQQEAQTEAQAEVEALRHYLSEADRRSRGPGRPRTQRTEAQEEAEREA